MPDSPGSPGSPRSPGLSSPAERPEPRPPVRAAGAVLWRQGAGGVEVALVHRPKYDDWSFPKGKAKEGEHELLTARREVHEETGILPRLSRRLRPSVYLKDGRPKRVDYWAATAETLAMPLEAVTMPHEAVREPVPTPAPVSQGTGPVEVDQVAWLPPASAAEVLTYEHDREVLREFSEGAPRTVPLIIARHSSAGDKRDWPDHDALRPLDQGGRAEARELADLLPAYGPFRLISSATARCVETLLPTALALRASVTTDLAFTIGQGDPDAAHTRLAELIDEGGPLVVCTHRELIGHLVDGLCAGYDERPPEEPGLRKGGFWVLHLALGGTEDRGRSAAPGPPVSVERHSVRPVSG